MRTPASWKSMGGLRAGSAARGLAQSVLNSRWVKDSSPKQCLDRKSVV